MKRLLPLALALLLLLSACADPPALRKPSPSVSPAGENNPTIGTTEEETDPLATTAGEETDPPAVTTEKETTPSDETFAESEKNPSDTEVGWVTELPDIFPVILTAYSLTEYAELLKENEKKLPDHFVFYEDIAHYGSFDQFYCYDWEDFSTYRYLLKDKSGTVVYFSVENESTITMENKLEPMEGSDYRHYPDEAFGQMTVGNIRYNYVKGGLYSVAFPYEKQYISIGADNMLVSYPANVKTPVSALLHASTAEAEAKALLAKIEK